jgi:hypothetical protein
MNSLVYFIRQLFISCWIGYSCISHWADLGTRAFSVVPGSTAVVARFLHKIRDGPSQYSIKLTGLAYRYCYLPGRRLQPSVSLKLLHVLANSTG